MKAEPRAAAVVCEVLRAFEECSRRPGGQGREEAAARAPHALAAVQALDVGFPDAAFVRNVSVAYPFLMDVIRADGVPAQLRAAVANLLFVRVFPLVQAGAEVLRKSGGQVAMDGQGSNEATRGGGAPLAADCDAGGSSGGGAM